MQNDQKDYPFFAILPPEIIPPRPIDREADKIRRLVRKRAIVRGVKDGLMIVAAVIGMAIISILL